MRLLAWRWMERATSSLRIKATAAWSRCRPTATLRTTVPATGLNQPFSVAVDGVGNLFIADLGNNRVVKVPANGGTQTTVGTGLNGPQGVAVDGAGNLFIADWGNNRVVEVPANGGPQIRVGTGLNGPIGLAVDGAGDIFIADSHNNRVVEVQLTVNFGSANVCPAGTEALPRRATRLRPSTIRSTTLPPSAPVNVLTQGTPNLDFTLGSTTCTGAQTVDSSCYGDGHICIRGARVARGSRADRGTTRGMCWRRLRSMAQARGRRSPSTPVLRPQYSLPD